MKGRYGMGKDIKKSFTDCSMYSDTIMTSIKEILDKNSIKYKINKNETEILVKNKDHNDIATLITTNINVPEDIVHMLIKFTVSGDEKDKLYIRIKFK